MNSQKLVLFATDFTIRLEMRSFHFVDASIWRGFTIQQHGSAPRLFRTRQINEAVALPCRWDALVAMGWEDALADGLDVVPFK